MGYAPNFGNIKLTTIVLGLSMEFLIIQSTSDHRTSSKNISWTNASNHHAKYQGKKTKESLSSNSMFDNFSNFYNATDFNLNRTDYFDTGFVNDTNEIESTSWSLCTEWTVAQHSLFQTANFFFAVAFLVPASFKQSVLLVRTLLMIGHCFIAMWAGFEICALDISIWSTINIFLNATHTAILALKFFPPSLSLEMTDLYLKVFKPLKVSKKHFKELIKESKVMVLKKGDIYAVEDVSPADERLSILLQGKLRVTCDDTHLHFVNHYQFVDSPEWEANHEQSDNVYQVTITAEEYSEYLCWDRMKLERVLRHRPMLKVVLDCIIGKDITQKLYAINDHMNSLNDDIKGTELAKVHQNRSMSLDAVNTGTTGLVRSETYQIQNVHFNEVGSLSKLQPDFFPPFIATQFPKASPFLKKNSPNISLKIDLNEKTKSNVRTNTNREVKFKTSK